jgi:hypothetical protein
VSPNSHLLKTLEKYNTSPATRSFRRSDIANSLKLVFLQFDPTRARQSSPNLQRIWKRSSRPGRNMCYTGKSILTAMQTLFQSRKMNQTDQQRPTWLRMLAMMCLLLLCVVSTAQVCHVHSELSLTGQDSRDSRQSVPDHCPLCVAMHSALPATAHTDAEPVLQVQTVLLKTVEIERVERRTYELFSRPPPVVSPQA